MPDLLPNDVDPERLKRILALTQPGVPSPQPSPAQPWMAGAGAEPRVPSRVSSVPEAPTVERLKPIGGDSLPVSDATRLQPIAPVKPTTPMAGTSADTQGRLQHLRDMDANPWGSANNHPGVLGKIGHYAAKVGNIAGDIVAPGVMANIPGTDLNRKVEEHGLERNLLSQQTEENRTAEEKTRQRHEQNTEDTNQRKLDEAQQKIDETENKDKSTRELSLRKQGLKSDAQGNIVPLTPDEMSENERAVHDLKVAQADSQVAKASLDRIKADPNSPQNQAVLQRVRTMAQNAATAAGKLGLDKEKFVADYFGLDKDGNPIAGTQKDDQGKPIGPRVANSGATSADRLKRADLARNVETNAIGFKQLIKDNPDLFGKIAGRFTTVEQMIGSDDPAIARAGVAVHNMALASNGAHGVRSQEAVKETENEILNHFRNGTDATMAAVDELVSSVQTFREDAAHGKRPNTTPIHGSPEEKAAEPPRAPKEGMKWQRNKSTGEFREVPVG